MNGTREPALWRLLRDVLLVCLGVFMLLHETLTREPRLVILMAGLALLAGPAAIRAIVTGFFGRGQ